MPIISMVFYTNHLNYASNVNHAKHGTMLIILIDVNLCNINAAFVFLFKNV